MPRTCPFRAPRLLRLARNRLRGALWKRFVLLLIGVTIVSLAPWLVTTRVQGRLVGSVIRMDQAASMRVRDGQLDEAVRRHDGAESWALAGRQREALALVLRGTPASGLPACTDAPYCERLGQSLAELDALLAETTSAGTDPDDRWLAWLASLDRGLLELEALDRDRLLVLADTTRSSALVVLALVALIGAGVWDVFGRVRRLQEATLAPDADARLERLGGRKDEVAALARSTRRALAELEEHRAREQARAERLERRARAAAAVSSALGAWIGGNASDGALEDALRLDARRDPDETDEERRIFAEMIAGNVAVAEKARQLLDERARRERLAALLATLPSLERDDAVRELSAALGELVPHDRLELLGAGHQRDGTVWAAAGATPDDPGGVRTAPDGALEVALRIEGRVIGLLRVVRAGAPFAAQDLDTLRAASHVIASALERMRLEALLHAAQQGEMLRGLGSKLADELRNPLNALSLQLQTLERRLARLGIDKPATTALLDHLRVIRGELERVHGQVASVLSLTSGEAGLRLEVVDLGEVCRDVLRGLGSMLDSLGIETDAALGDGRALVLADPARVADIVHHLIKNAAEAMRTTATRRLSLRIEAADDEVRLHVLDTGTGVADASRLFAPARSTKPDGHGLGLAISQRIARLQHGDLAYQPRGGEAGAEFVLTLARAPEGSAGRASGGPVEDDGQDVEGHGEGLPLPAANQAAQYAGG